MQQLLTFACLTMCASALMGLLPQQSSLRRTALLAAGLLVAAMWLQSLPSMLPDWPLTEAPSTWLIGTGTQPMAARQQSLMQQMQEGTAHEQTAGMAAP